MAGTFIQLPVLGAGGIEKVADFASLPATADLADVYITEDNGTLYYWDGDSWEPVPSSLPDIIAAGTTTKPTFDAKGRITVNGSLLAGDIPALDAAKITTGTFDIARIPQSALERLAAFPDDQAARYALTTATVQNGDSVKQLDTGVMWVVVDQTKLGEAAGWVDYAAGTAAAVPWSGVTGKPGWTAQQADATHDGYLVQADWGTFNGKVATNRTISTTAPLTGGGDLSADRTISIPAADATHDGYLAQGDWSAFNGKMSGSAKIVNITAETAGGVAGAGEIGQLVSSSVSSPSATGVGASGAWGDVTSIALTNGEWFITGLVGFSENGAVLSGAVLGGGKSTIGDSAPAFGNYTSYPFLVTGTDSLVPIASHRVSVSGGSITYYLKTKMTYSSGSPQHFGYIQAERYR